MPAIYKDGKWYGGDETGHLIKNNGTDMFPREGLNLTGFDVSDDSTNDETDVKVHRLTPAELDEVVPAVPPTPLNDLIVYSLEERVIGWWIDGKPVYQKVITGLSVALAYNTWKQIATIPGAKGLVSCEAFYVLSDTDSILISGAGLEFNLHDGVLSVESNVNINLRTINMIIIRYTKTTD